MILNFAVGIVAFDCLMVAFVATVSEIARHIRRRGEVGDDRLAMLITDDDLEWLESVGVDTEGGHQ